MFSKNDDQSQGIDKKPLQKNLENFEIHPKFAEIGRFEFGIFRETTNFLDFLCICKGNVKGNHLKSMEVKQIGGFGENFDAFQIDLSRRIFDGFQNFRYF